MLKYIADVIVNGPDPSLGAVGGEPAIVDPTVPALDPMTDMPKKTEPSLRDIYVKVCQRVTTNRDLFLLQRLFRL